MEMGTGKTRTALEVAYKRLQSRKIKRVLWLCPCSVKSDLRQDIAKHSDGMLSKIAIAGLESLSASERLYVTLLNYVMKGRTMLIVDESNLVKNFKAKRTQRIIQIAGQCDYRMIMNGTPVSRNEADLFAQWYILDWRILGYRSYWGFANNHLEYDEKFKGRVRRVLNVDYLTDKISPYSYAVKKKDVMNLPDKCYHTFKFSLTSDQREHYYDVMDKFLATLVSEDDESAIYRTFTALQQVSSGRRIISEPELPILHEPFFKNPKDNPRLRELLDAVEWCEDEKVIIWCKYQHEIETVFEALSGKYGESSARVFNGKISLKNRQKALEDFKNDTHFLISNKSCGGYGLNLQFCHCMIYYSNDWDWATRAQSEDRVHRIGQENDISIIDICSDFGIDKKIIDCLSRKERMVDEFKKHLKEKNARKWLEGEND